MSILLSFLRIIGMIGIYYFIFRFTLFLCRVYFNRSDLISFFLGGNLFLRKAGIFIFLNKNRKIEEILDVVVESFRLKGFVFKVPRIRTSRQWASWACVKWSGLAVSNENLIIISKKCMQSYANRIVETIIAHELSHLIQNLRLKIHDHPLFEKINHLDSEYRADAMTAYVYSKEAVIEMRRPTGYMLNEPVFLQTDLICDHPEPKPKEIFIQKSFFEELCDCYREAINTVIRFYIPKISIILKRF